MGLHPFINGTSIDMGIRVAGHSDDPVSPADAMLRLHDLVTWRGSDGKQYGPEQCITVEEAIEAFTLGGPYASFEEKSKGSITPGKLADFVVLGADPLKADPETIKDIRVLQTWIDGKPVYDRKQP